MPSETFYLLAVPAQAPALRPWKAFPALFTCRLNEDGSLSYLEAPPTLTAGVMVVSDAPAPLAVSPDRLAHLIIRECVRRGARGLLLDFDAREDSRGRLISRLSGLLSKAGPTLFVPEYYAPAAPRARILVSSALSGGTLEERLEEALARFGPERTVLALERAAEDFSIPAPDGCGRPLSDEELTRMRRSLCPAEHFSAPLCARYFTYRAPSGAVRLVLFDDEDTLLRKMETARRVGLRRFLLPWAEVCGNPGRFGISRR